MGCAMYEVRPAGPASLRSVQGAAPLAPLRGYPCPWPYNRTLFDETALPLLAKRSFHHKFQSKETITTKKSREELEKELAEATAKLEQYRHRQQRLENRYHDYRESRRKKRNHRLITRGGAVESIAPEVRGMSERDFYALVQQVFSLPEAAALVSRATDQQEGE